MSFYKNVPTLPKLIPGDLYNPGDILIYKDRVVEVRRTHDITNKGSFTTTDCKKYCVLAEHCVVTNNYKPSSHDPEFILSARCTPAERKDRESIVFTEYKL